MNRTLITILFAAAGCTATVRSAPPPAEPMPPPPPAPNAPVAQPAPPPAQPMPPPPAYKHPKYLEAMSDLRLARAYLSRPANIHVKWDERKAIQQIDDAMDQIVRASINDGKNIDDHPPIDAPTWGGRLQKSLELIQQAYNDVKAAEENPSPAVQGYRQSAAGHLDTAMRLIREGIEDAKSLHESYTPPPAAAPPPPPPAAPAAHPAFATALGNLRQARALLERQGGPGDVKWDEKVAIGEIDAAMKEARDARMDDGVPLTEHPPIDNKMVYRDRLREAMKLLGESAKDLDEREDNAWAKKDRHNAVEHVKRAEKQIREAISDRKADAQERKDEKREEHAEKHGH